LCRAVGQARGAREVKSKGMMALLLALSLVSLVGCLFVILPLYLFLLCLWAQQQGVGLASRARSRLFGYLLCPPYLSSILFARVRIFIAFTQRGFQKADAKESLPKNPLLFLPYLRW
jgi:hypothetical protein